MSTLEKWVETLMNPSPLGLVLSILVALSIPLFLHNFVFRSSGYIDLPSILVLGPSGSGKTALVTLFEQGKNIETHTSQAPLSVECSVPVGTAVGSNKYRSDYDPTNDVHKKFFLVDTPGHGKLRYLGLEQITTAKNVRGIMFMVDAATLSIGDTSAGGLRATAEYLHNTLLYLQKALPKMKGVKEIPVVIAANKLDLFTALPAALVKSTLEGEITKIRRSKSKGLLDSGVGMNDTLGAEEEDDWLGEMGDGDFKFAQMEEFGIPIETLGGNVLGSEGSQTEKWWKWIGERL